ncbi:hypothetical protein GOV06_02880 [Candidatus Woesearchaeota archaeon]|nr:hypothetical protein [Candidatus Woesearchaeota archaeon]
MVKEIFSRIIESIERKVFDKENDIDESRFIDVKKVDCGRMAFIDGGQAELLKANNFSLQFIRTAALIFGSNQKKESIVNEFFVLISICGEEYETEIFAVKGECVDEIKINSFDETIKEGKERASISKVGGIVRRFAELELAKQIVGKSEVVVLDGSLKSMVKGEKEKIEELFRKGEEKGVVISGLAKTSRMIKDGECILSKLAGKEGEWYYRIRPGVGAVRLNKQSRYIFEFNINMNQEDKTNEVLGGLAANSNDNVFPGYPYGLIMVDKLARVSNEGKDYLLTLFKANAGKKWGKLKTNLNVLNAHEILDNI